MNSFRNDTAKQIEINGIVQGVGFRPFVFQLAGKYGLRGEVSNTSSGVTIFVEGNQKQIEQFLTDLTTTAPPLAQITEIKPRTVSPAGYQTFAISRSKRQSSVSTLISPDVSVCPDCLEELFNPNDRRFKYPFINCTNCGPRYTIISDIPYDRPNTSMKPFPMCPDCQQEYEDPLNRRFHAQPNACQVCGPHVSLYDRNRIPLTAASPVDETARLLKSGAIVAIKGLGGFHLAVDAQNDAAVTRLRKAKHREEKPFALMSADCDQIRTYARLLPEEERLLMSIQRPIVLLEKQTPNSISDQVSPRNRYFGVMIPYTPLHYLLLDHHFTALVMTSGNMSDEPIAIDNDDAFLRLAGIADYFLIHNRDIYLRSDDSIVRYVSDDVRIIRRSRGYVPTPIFLKKKVPQIIACGAELKNTVCLTRENRAFLSQHIGDLENLSTLEFFEMTIDHMKRILDIHPDAVAHDRHPDYLSTRFAFEQDIQKISVQHHHAHIASCMAENGVDDTVIGLSFDGTGYGDDATIWGGEVLIAEYKGFERIASIDCVPMPGGDAAIKEPWRMAVSYLYRVFGDRFHDLDLQFLKHIDQSKMDVIVKMIENRVNTPLTSSMGRIFDGVAAVCGLRNQVFFEGQAAMEFEMKAAEGVFGQYDWRWQNRDICRLDIEPMIRGIVSDLQNNIPVSVISSKFHQTLIETYTHLCCRVRKNFGLKKVVLSGGVFQNAFILKGLINRLKSEDFQVYSHCRVPTNDGGISLGQAVAAARMLER